MNTRRFQEKEEKKKEERLNYVQSCHSMTGEKGLKIEDEVLVFLWVPYGYLKKTGDELRGEVRRE